MLFLIWVFALVTVVVLYCRQIYTRFSRHGVKHLTSVPLLGNMAGTTFCTEHFFHHIDKIYRSFPGERFVGYFEYLRPVVLIRDIELVTRITVKDFEYFVNHSFIVDENIDPLFGKILFAMKDEKWKEMRSTLSPAFTSAKMRMMVPFMTEAGEHMVSRIRRSIQESGKNCFDVDFIDISSRHANDVIASCAFGLNMDSQNQANTEFFEMGKAASYITFLQIFKLFGYQSFPSIMKILKMTMFASSTQNFFRKLVTQTMNDRKARNIYRPDMIHLLMEAKKGNLHYEEEKESADDINEKLTVGKKTAKRAWTDDDLTAQALSFFIAGFEPVAQAITFLVYELALNPDIQERLAQEIKENNRKNDGKLDFTSIQQMTYLDMVVSELLRLWSSDAVLDRICNKDYNLGRPNDDATEDYIIRKGEGVKIGVWALHRDPQFYPNPTKFDPERFSAENRRKIPSFAYFPFGIGPRNCIGFRFALCEIKVMIYQLLQHIRIGSCERTRSPIELVTNTMDVLIKGGHWVRLQLRE